MNNHGFGIEARHPSGDRPHAHRPARYLVLIVDATGVTAARLFDAERRAVADFDGGSQEVAVMTQGLTPTAGAATPEWDAALSGHSVDERRAAEIYTLDV
jgi:hypothetical protein